MHWPGGEVSTNMGSQASSWEPGRSSSDTPPMRNKPLLVPPRARVEQPDANTVNIRQPHGGVDTRSGGSLAWRTNNPGLLPFNPVTRLMGAIGAVDGVAVFRNEDAGRSALTRLMLGQLR